MFAKEYLLECNIIINKIDTNIIEKMADIIVSTRKNRGRLFIIGSGGGAGHASHAVSDFRKLCNIEAYSPYDNVSELTARVNDEGWEVSLINWIKVSRLNKNDCIFVFSVGGGSIKKKISINIVRVIIYAKKIGSKIIGVVGKEGGDAKKVGDAVVVIPPIYPKHVTPQTEGLQSVIWHLLVSHPKLQMRKTKWESTK